MLMASQIFNINENLPHLNMFACQEIAHVTINAQNILLHLHINLAYCRYVATPI